MRLRLSVLLLTTLLVAACQPQIIYVVFSPTPSPEVTEAVSLSTETPAAATAEVTPEVTAVVQAATNAPPTPLEVTIDAQVAPTETPAPETPSATPEPTNYPTPVFQEILVAEQLFEHGRMFWLQPIGQIWVLVVTSEGRGTWTVYDDNYTEADPDNDPSIVAPEGLLQPERGFGKLWREVQQVRDELGWAVTPEFGYVSRYEFHAGGTVNNQGVFTQIPGTGYHVLFSLYGEQFRFNEADSTWKLGI